MWKPTLIAGLALASLGTEALAADGGVIEAAGEAQIIKGDKVAAKKAAVADAMKNAVEKVVGVTVQSDFSSELKETVKNNQNAFEAKVRDAVSKKSEGFIKNHELLEEKVDGDIFKVKIRAEVFESKIKAEVEELAKLIAAAGNPKIMIVIQDVVTDESGDVQVQPESMLGTHIEKLLIERSIEVRGRQAAAAVARDDAREYDAWAKEAENIADMARKNGADILVFGRVEIKNKGKIENAAFAALNGQTRVEIQATIRGVNAATGELFSAEPAQMSSMGLNIEKAVYRALKGRGQNLITRVWEPLFDNLKDSFRKSASMGSAFVVVLKNVKSFRKEGRAFIDLLGSLPDVSGVQHSFRDGRVRVELSCKCSSQDLQDRIFNAVEGQSTFGTLDVDGVSGKQLAFKL